MNNIINALLLLAGVSKSRNIPREPITNMQILVEQVLNERLRYALEESKGSVSFPENWQVAMGYAPWVEEIWSNYLSNGLKYGGAQPHLEIGSEVQMDGYVRFGCVIMAMVFLLRLSNNYLYRSVAYIMIWNR